MTDDEIAAALFSGEYDHLTVAEFAERFPRESDPWDGLTGFTLLDVPVIDGVATLPDGTTVRSGSKVVQVAIPTRDATATAVQPETPRTD